MTSPFKRILVGKPIASSEEQHQRIGKPTALAVFASDAVSSTAYATEEMMLVLLTAVVYPQALEYLVPIGAFEQPDGWRWKIDASMRMGGFGPWRPEWSMSRLPSLGMPVLCVLGLDIEVMGWGTLPEDVIAHLPPTARFVPLDGVGHFVHIERPDVVADLILDVLA